MPVVVLNGASSSGKSSIARALQEVLLPDPWLTFGIDTLIAGLPPSLGGPTQGLDLRDDGSITVGPEFRRLESAWCSGLGAMARCGVHLVLDDVFLGGAASQDRLRSSLGDLDVRWVGVHCAPEEAARRERARGDRVVGQAAHQAALVHEGVTYDLELDTTHVDARTCAEQVVEALGL